jgi:hypothetical protein
MGPAAPRPARPARARNEPLDPFAPPELATEEPLLELADEDRSARRGPPSESAPPQGPAGSGRWSSQAQAQRPGSSSVPPGLGAEPPQRAVPSMPPGAASGLPRDPMALTPSGLPVPSLSSASDAAPTRARRLGIALEARIPQLASARVRLAAGVALAIVLGFIPANLVAGMRERSAFGAIDAKITAVQSTADTPDSYAALDAFRAEQLDAKYGARRSIAVTSLLVWAAIGAALGYGWFTLFRSPPVLPAPRSG